ncbi:unnamed protein product, partial [Rotaria sp. Silwood1]
MCGTIQCYYCQVEESIPHLGYIQPVKICKSCASQKRIITTQTISDCLRQAIQEDNSENL